MPRGRALATKSAGSDDSPHEMRSLADVILDSVVRGPGHGGKRANAGRKIAGNKRGRAAQKVPALSHTTPRKVITDKAVTVHKDANATGALLPIDHMLAVLRDPDQPEQRRDDMAKAAAPYLHPRLVAAEVRSRSLVQVIIKIEGDDAALL